MNVGCTETRIQFSMNRMPVTENESPVVEPEEDAGSIGAETEYSKQRDCINGVYVCAKATLSLLLINVALFGVAAGLSGKYQQSSRFPLWAVIYRGSCTASDRWGVAIHLIINILSTAILAASNYCMQVLVAPNREVLDDYHARHQWLDIGRASIRNIFATKRYRLVLWAVLLLTATPFHLFYNSVLTQFFASTDFEILVGPMDLSAENVWNLTTPGLEKCFGNSSSMNQVSFDWREFTHDIATLNYKSMSGDDCTNLTSAEAGVKNKAIVALAQNLTVLDGGDKSILRAARSFSDKSIVEADSRWPPLSGKIKAGAFSKQTNDLSQSTYKCTRNFMENFENYHAVNATSQRRYSIQQCILIPADEYCELLYSPPLCTAIIVAILVKVLVMLLAVRLNGHHSAPILTVGDAVETFITTPDPITERLCWISNAHIQKGLWGNLMSIWTIENGEEEIHLQRICRNTIYQRLSYPKTWRDAPSLRQYLLTFIPSLLSIGTGLYFFFNRSKEGKALSNEIFLSQSLPGWEWGPLGSIILANTPQLVITISYYFYNSLLTSMLVAAEYSSFGAKKKPLRVTWPIKGSKQRSTYWLSMPYVYAIPALALYSTLHWTVSQSLFYYHFIQYDVHGEPIIQSEVSSLASSGLAVLSSCCLGTIMLLALVGLSFRKLDSAMPLAGTCSAAISAACHLPQGENSHTAVLGPISWGETDTAPVWMTNESGRQPSRRYGHCSFTSLHVKAPNMSKLYA